MSKARILARSRIKGEQADVGRMVDDDRQTWWSSGEGDLAVTPLDVDIQLHQPHVVDSLVVVTSALKGQLRLKDFDLFAAVGGAWDGARPLARVRENKDEVVRVRFPAVRVDWLRLRLLGTHRPDNSFAHIAELAVYEAAGQPRRAVESSPFTPTPADADHDPQRLRNMIDSLAVAAASSRVAQKRLAALRERLRLIEESARYEGVLRQIDADTKRFGTGGTPPWALAQRDCMARLRNWAYYWIDHQQPDGQFGAGYEDDVELVCGWPVLVLAQDDAKVRQALQRLADGVWNSLPFLQRFGYDRLTDVEHSAEKTSYSQPTMVVIDAENPRWSQRCRRTVATLSEHFLSRNERQQLQFRSDYFGFDPRTLQAVTRENERPFDIPEAAKALKPAMYAVWATQDEQAKQVMLDYGRTWVAAAADGDGPGRIAGLLPEKVLWPSGQPVGTHAHLASMRATLLHLIGCYRVSGDERYLEPIQTLLEKTVVAWSVGGIPSAGTLDEVRGEDHVGLLEQLALIASLYRHATADTRFDSHLARWTARIRDTLVDGVKSYILIDRKSDVLWHVDRPLTVGAYLESRCAVGAQLYLGWQVTGDDEYLSRLGLNLSSCLNDKWGAFTYWFYDKSEPRVTSNDHLAHKLQNTQSALCLMYLGGAAPVEAVWPDLAVTWQNTGDNFCALVHCNSSQGLLVHLYSFDAEPRIITANLWELSPGAYQATVGPDADRDGRPDKDTWQTTIDVSAQRKLRSPATLRFSLPPRALTSLEVRPQ